MGLEQVIQTINRMHADGVIGPYAIGGAVGATFYLEPLATIDVDIFVALRPEPGRVVITLQPIYDYLLAMGCTLEGEYVHIAGWPVQFLPPTGPLVEEALDGAVEVDIGGTTARVLSAEHLAAIALQTGRAKDKARLLMFLEAEVLDISTFQAILGRHGLQAAWAKFETQFREEQR